MRWPRTELRIVEYVSVVIARIDPRYRTLAVLKVGN